MVKLTTEEKKLQQEAFLSELPKRFMDIQSLALKVGAGISIKLIESGPELIVRSDDRHDDFSYTISYESDDWEITYLKDRLEDIWTKLEAAAARKVFAQVAFDKLSTDEKLAVKEYIHSIR